MSAVQEAPKFVTVTVELFGNAQLLTGRHHVRLSVADDSTLADIAETVGGEHPVLVGTVVRDDLRGFLDSYTVNLNGVEFMDEHSQRIREGDALLVFSSQAGG